MFSFSLKDLFKRQRRNPKDSAANQNYQSRLNLPQFSQGNLCAQWMQMCLELMDPSGINHCHKAQLQPDGDNCATKQVHSTSGGGGNDYRLLHCTLQRGADTPYTLGL